MVDEEHLDDVFHVEKCSGIPMCPAEYHFDMVEPPRPVEVEDSQIYFT